MQNIINGKALPSLVVALKIEYATGGAVTCKDWLKTRWGKLYWNDWKSRHG